MSGKWRKGKGATPKKAGNKLPPAVVETIHLSTGDSITPMGDHSMGNDKKNDKPWHKLREIIIALVALCMSIAGSIVLWLVGPNSRLIVVVVLVVLFGLCSFSACLVAHYFGHLRSGGAIGILASLLLTVGLGWYKWPQPAVVNPVVASESKVEVYRPFRVAYERYKTELGSRPSQKQSAGDMPVEYAHELAMVFWSEPLGFYKLRNDGYCEFEDDPIWNQAVEWDNDEVLNGLFPDLLKQGKKPPRLGVASHWHDKSDKWEWIGGYDWDCRFFPDAVSFQEFETRSPDQPGSCGKLIIGPLRTSLKEERGYVLVILDHAWHKVPFDGPIPPCRERIEAPKKKHIESKTERLRRQQQEALKALNYRNPK
jgi:hypothetical protein